MTKYRVVWWRRDMIRDTTKRCDSLSEAEELLGRVQREDGYAYIEELPDKTWAEMQAEGFLGMIEDRWRSYYACPSASQSPCGPLSAEESRGP
jgi:hypothetical protein